MGLVCSGKCGQDTVGPEPDVHTPPRHPGKTTAAPPPPPQQALRKDVPIENSDSRNLRRSDCDLRASGPWRQDSDNASENSEAHCSNMPTRSLLVKETLPDDGDTRPLLDSPSGKSSRLVLVLYIT